MNGRPGRLTLIGEDRRRQPIQVSTRQLLAIAGMGAEKCTSFDLSAAAFVAIWLAACSATPETGQGAKENTGTLVGALAGSLIGSQFGGGTGERVAAGLAGAAIGGLIGNRIGAGMDDEDKQRAYAAQMQALEPAGRVQRSRGKIRIPAATVRWFRALPTSRTVSNAGNTPTRSISTAVRRWRAAPPAAIPTAPGRRWAEPSQLDRSSSLKSKSPGQMPGALF